MKRFILLLLCAVCPQTALTHSTDFSVQTMRQTLLEIAQGTRNAAQLTVTYDDRHGLWGGVTVVVSGTGSYERQTRKRGPGKAQVTRKTLPVKEVRKLADLLVQVEAWKQETPERKAVPDESRARLIIRVGSTEVKIWEWYNEMAKNNRLVKVRDKLVQLGD